MKNTIGLPVTAKSNMAELQSMIDLGRQVELAVVPAGCADGPNFHHDAR